MAIASPHLCMQRCTLSSMLLACPPPSRSSPNRWNVAHPHDNKNNIGHEANSNTVFYGTNAPKVQSKARRKKRNKFETYPSNSTNQKDCACPSDGKYAPSQIPAKGSTQWSARRRDRRVNGTDLYVARFTKNGIGNARPCWRCVEWCRWAGVRRIFHYDGELGLFLVVKVNGVGTDTVYETQSDVRLYAGMSWL